MGSKQITNSLTKKPLKEFFSDNFTHQGLLLILSVWLFDPAINAYILDSGTFYQHLFSPEPHEIYFRTVISALLLLFILLTRIANKNVKIVHQQALKQQAKLEQFIEVTPECVKSVDKDGTLLEMNQAGLNIVEANEASDVCGECVYNLIAPEHRQLYIDFNQRVFSGKAEKIEYDVIGLKGSRKTVESHAVPIFNDLGEVTTHLAITRDITESRLLAEKLNYQATHDELTGLINRVEFKRRLDDALKRSHVDKVTHAVFFIDLDQFKVINDTSGHLAGDQLLIEIASMMKEQIRQQDSTARIGGDEFAILLQCCPLGEALNIAEKIRLRIDGYRFSWEQHHYSTSTSIGVVCVNDNYQSVDDILRDADTACLMAKESGRNRVKLHKQDSESVSRYQGDMCWVSKIHDGIEQQKFLLYAQLIEGLANFSGEKHYEILLRYQDSDGNILPPGAFLPTAERFSLSPKIDRYVISSTLKLLTENPTLLDHASSFSINLSGLSMADEQFLSFALEQFTVHQKLAHKICFEITETAAINNLNNAKLFIKKLKALGCCFALDDFGSGMASFAYLKSFPVKYVKIDGSFVRNIVDDSIDMAMVRSINEIAQLMGKKTIAEFVEDEHIKLKLETLGVDFVQGYGIQKPIPVTDLLL